MNLTIASSADDSAAAEAVIAHHSQMLDDVRPLVEAVLLAAEEARNPHTARDAVTRWCRAELLPHAKAEEEVLYAAARPAAPALIDAMTSEHTQLTYLIDELAAQGHPVRIAAAARALLAVLESHITKENTHVLPLLAADPAISVAALLESMHGALAAPVAAHDCTCDEADHSPGASTSEPDHPVLDARAVPHAIRHATVFGALDAVREGRGLILVAPHDPLPLLAQLEKRSPNTFSVSYLERGPEAWRLSIVREKTA